MELSTRWLRPTLVVSVSAIGPYEETVAEAWHHLRTLLLAQGARESCRPIFALLQDMPHEVRPEARRLQLCAQISNDWRPRLQRVAAVHAFQGGAYLTARHAGAYENLPNAFSRMYAACSLDMNVTLDGLRPRVLFFDGDPADVPPEHLTAELGLPVLAQPPERPRMTS